MRRRPLFHKKMHFGRRGGSARLLLRMIALLLLILSAFFLIDSRIRPVICSIAESQARSVICLERTTASAIILPCIRKSEPPPSSMRSS